MIDRLVTEVTREPRHEQPFVAADIDQQYLRLTVRDLVELGLTSLLVPMARIERVAVVQREPQIADRGGKFRKRQIGIGKFRTRGTHQVNLALQL
jgi:hypothetical protein